MARPYRNFAPMPLSILAAKTTPAEKLFILALMHHDWDGEKAWPSMARIGKITGLTARTLQKAKDSLEAKGYLKTISKDGKANHYEMDIPSMLLDEYNATLNPSKKYAPTSAKSAQDPRNNCAPTINTSQITKPIENNTPTAMAESATPPKVKTPEPYLEIIRAAWLKAGLILVEPGWPIKSKVAKQGSLVGEEVFKKVVNDYLAFFGPNSKEGPSIGGFILYKFEGLANKYMAQKRHQSEEANAQLQRYLKGR
jgi:hypothetical protein